MVDLLYQLFVTGQGSGGSPHFCISVSEAILTCIEKKLEGFTCKNPTGTLCSTQHEDAFVDDAGLVIGDTGGDLVEKLRLHSQLHKKYLHVTGGKLALHNSASGL